MRVRVVLFGGVRVVVGKSGVDLSFDLPTVTVGQLVEELIATYPRVQPYLLDAAGMLNSSLRVLINKERPVPDATLATGVCDGDEVAFLVAVAGGSREVVLRDEKKKEKWLFRKLYTVAVRPHS